MSCIMGTQKTTFVQPAHLPNTCQRVIDTPRGQYLIQVSWPLGWRSDGSTDDPEAVNTPIIYVIDGNAYFSTATDVVRRLQSSFGREAIVVGVGYPITDSVYAGIRRCADLTPPSKRGLIEPPRGRDGKPHTEPSFGGAAEFHHILEETIMPTVQEQLFSTLPLREMPSALFGHSFGGLFTLFSLFTKPGLFDTYISASPSIWFNRRGIIDEQEKEFLEGPKRAVNPQLYIMYGSLEEDVARKPYESESEFEERKKLAEEWRMKSNAVGMAGRLERCGKLDDVWLQELIREDHGSAAVCALQRGIVRLLGEWAP